MSDRKEVPHKGIRLTIDRESTGKYTVYFTNMPDNFEELGNLTPLKDKESFEEALAAGKQFVDEHQWKRVQGVGVFDIYVRLWWTGDWGYRIEGFSSDAGFKSFEQAEKAAIKAATEEDARLDEEIEKSRR